MKNVYELYMAIKNAPLINCYKKMILSQSINETFVSFCLRCSNWKGKAFGLILLAFQTHIRKSFWFKACLFLCQSTIDITHKIFSSFDDKQEVRTVFLNISDAFNKLWDKGNIHEQIFL